MAFDGDRTSMKTNATFQSTAPATVASARAAALLPALASAGLGLFLLWGVGFSHIDVFHNAAHDTRHSNAFPCH
jgi:cobalt transporter subunit CbtB